MSDISDNYPSEIWNRIREPQVKSLMENIFKAIKDFRFTFSTSKGVREKYSINDDTLYIVKKEAELGNTGENQSVSEVISFSIYLDKNEQVDDEKICDDSIYIINYYKKLNLDFMLTINYINSNKEEGTAARLELNSNVIAKKNNIKRFITHFKDGKV